ncbi:hypothetical protein [Streptomyces cacaoi]|uniref:Flp family type IVb pilin n=1 Tax=Streptomyces cacaoi TaxID=1898 RepID=A0A4Y3R8H3_STRCI|nr:hypothetical protein [Streptomyces cacaoi]NNG88005.1 hypothetical protein [Streptomyces cacaoi]GEB52140.1 hypothetical protein SCA03_46910 [Streptomyces cacaoi]
MSNAVRRWWTAVRNHARAGDRGASSIEYAGIVILVAGIIIAIRALGLDALISDAILKGVNQVLGN